MMKSTILTGHPLWQTFIAMALTPGVCEELLFRGAILGLLCTSMKAPRAAVITACLFGLFHMSAFRFAPTTLAGLVLCFVAISTGSIYPAMILHAVHNAGAIIAAINEKQLQLWLIIPALCSTVCGAALLGWFTPFFHRQRKRPSG